MTIRAVARGGGIPLTVNGTTTDGKPIVAGRVIAKPAKPGKGDCGCTGAAPVFVDAAGPHLPTDG